RLRLSSAARASRRSCLIHHRPAAHFLAQCGFPDNQVNFRVDLAAKNGFLPGPGVRAVPASGWATGLADSIAPFRRTRISGCPETRTEVEASRLEWEAIYVDILADHPATKAELRVRLQTRKLLYEHQALIGEYPITWNAKSGTTRPAEQVPPPHGRVRR